ncbi:MAG: hypothetical protein SFT81_06100 [Candidatus Caenarcaniphilales bacterium]|nr:hypothetical protein [Candidatus Caenarcaniphilales bacterium]
MRKKSAFGFNFKIKRQNLIKALPFTFASFALLSLGASFTVVAETNEASKSCKLVGFHNPSILQAEQNFQAHLYEQKINYGLYVSNVPWQICYVLSSPPYRVAEDFFKKFDDSAGQSIGVGDSPYQPRKDASPTLQEEPKPIEGTLAEELKSEPVAKLEVPAIQQPNFKPPIPGSIDDPKKPMRPAKTIQPVNKSPSADPIEANLPTKLKPDLNREAANKKMLDDDEIAVLTPTSAAMPRKPLLPKSSLIPPPPLSRNLPNFADEPVLRAPQ